jgi:hypothetical protein
MAHNKYKNELTMSVFSDMDKAQENNQLEQHRKYNQCPLNRGVDFYSKVVAIVGTLFSL